MKFQPINSSELTLRVITASDVGKAYIGWLNNPQVTKYLEVRMEEVTLETQRDYVTKIYESSHSCLFGIFEKNNSMIGTIKIGPINFHHGFGEIGLLIGEPEFWGKGFGSKAIGMLCEAFFEFGVLRKVTAGVTEGNLGSMRAFEKNGFVIEGLLRNQNIGVNGELLNVIRYGRIAKVLG